LAVDDLCPVAIRIFPLWNFPSASSVNMLKPGAIPLPAISAGLWTDIVNFRVDKGKNGVMKWFANQYVGGGFTDGSGNLFWRLLHDGKPVTGFEMIPFSLGTNQAPREVAPVHLMADRIVELQVTNAGIVPASQIIEGGVFGWLYPKDEEPPGIFY
jgi:hypothetical protein